MFFQQTTNNTTVFFSLVSTGNSSDIANKLQVLHDQCHLELINKINCSLTEIYSFCLGGSLENINGIEIKSCTPPDQQTLDCIDSVFSCQSDLFGSIGFVNSLLIVSGAFLLLCGCTYLSTKCEPSENSGENEVLLRNRSPV